MYVYDVMQRMRICPIISQCESNGRSAIIRQGGLYVDTMACWNAYVWKKVRVSLVLAL
jgi:hypothetical protein